jgi:UDP-N-acetylglucosamine--N-acetylmuramyl-(pentapeptide) pyrophosphoryl-undecaprenol N-acetylglucosamine transferase
VIGLWQSHRLLRRLKPDIIFIKGGFVGVPVGLAAARAHIPYITHDSDALPGLANRVIGRWARHHAVALPASVYPYPPDKTVTTGIPLRKEFVPVTAELRERYRRDLKLPVDSKMLFIIGGGLGSERVNQAVAEAVPTLLGEFEDLYVIHAVGRGKLDSVRASYARLTTEEQARLQVFDYLDDVYRYSGAADIIITRAGATNLAEFALQGKACIVLPSPFLAGGHQIKNAQYLAEQGAAIVLNEADLLADPHRLAKQVSKLLRSPATRQKLGAELATFAKADATAALARLILEQAAI